MLNLVFSFFASVVLGALYKPNTDGDANIAQQEHKQAYNDKCADVFHNVAFLEELKPPHALIILVPLVYRHE